MQHDSVPESGCLPSSWDWKQKLFLRTSCNWKLERTLKTQAGVQQVEEEGHVPWSGCGGPGGFQCCLWLPGSWVQVGLRSGNQMSGCRTSVCGTYPRAIFPLQHRVFQDGRVEHDLDICLLLFFYHYHEFSSLISLTSYTGLLAASLVFIPLPELQSQLTHRNVPLPC